MYERPVFTAFGRLAVCRSQRSRHTEAYRCTYILVEYASKFSSVNVTHVHYIQCILYVSLSLALLMYCDACRGVL